MKSLHEHISESLNESKEKFTKKDLEQLKSDWNNLAELHKAGFFKEMFKNIGLDQERIDQINDTLKKTNYDDLKLNEK